MAIIPERIQDQLDFFQQHATVWDASPTSIGLTAAQTTAFKTLVNEALSAYTAQVSAEGAKRSATLAAQSARGDARERCAELLAIIKGFAVASADPNAVYERAEIPPPAAPSPNPPPGPASDVTIGVDGSGALTLKWKSVNAAGGFFQVHRKLGASSVYINIGGTGTREFRDATLPLGVTNATYQIVGYRGTVAGTPSTPVNVQFGVGAGGGAGLAVTGGTLAMAA